MGASTLRLYDLRCPPKDNNTNPGRSTRHIAAATTDHHHHHNTTAITFRATMLQQAIRAFLHAVTFGGAYIIMLLVMYFNGYIIISVFLGAGIGKFLCDWLVVKIDIST